MRNRTRWVGFVGRLLAAVWPAHDDRASRGSPAESFEIPYLVTPRERDSRGAWRSLFKVRDCAISLEWPSWIEVHDTQWVCRVHCHVHGSVVPEGDRAAHA